MLKLILVLSIALCLAAHSSEWTEIHGDGTYTVSDQSKAQHRLRSLEKDFGSGNPAVLAERGNYALRFLINKIAVVNLKKKGHYDTAREVEIGWKSLDGELQRLVAQGHRQIGDFKPWSEKLALIYLMIEAKLGYPTCHLLRIDLIATYVWTPVVIFDPCRYGRTEFEFHFTEDDPMSPHPYTGFLPATTYLLTTISCSIATFSMGLVFPVCSPIAWLVEMGTREYLSPKLATFIYDKSCTL